MIKYPGKPYRDTSDRDVPSGRPRRERIDLGLALLSLARRPGVQFTNDEIAAWAGCTEMNIRRIERRALRKVRAALERKGVRGVTSDRPEAEVAALPQGPRPLRAEMPFKQWVWEEAERTGLNPTAIYMRRLRRPQDFPNVFHGPRGLMVRMAA